MRAAGPATLVIALSSACTHEHVVPTLHPTAAAATATAELADGSLVVVHAAETSDGYRWTAQSGTGVAWTTLDSSRIRSYRTTDHLRGAGEGLAYGFLGGAVMGGLLGAGGGVCVDYRSRGECALLGSAFVGGIGLVLGTLAGAVSGAHDVYRVGSGPLPRVSTAIAPGHASAALSWSF